MNRSLNLTAFRNCLAPACEFFRAVSGLFAIGALIVLITITPRLGESNHLPIADAAADDRLNEADRPASRTSVIVRPPMQETIVFYLVATPEQEYEVNWSENVDPYDYSRHYRVLYARDEAELYLAHQIVMQYMLTAGEEVIVRLVDFRSFNPPVPGA